MVAATSDSKDTTAAMAARDGITFPVAYAVSKEDIAEMDPWWTEDHHGVYVQPLELLLLRGGTIFGSMYASGPVGRMDVDEMFVSLRGRERRRAEQAQQPPRAP